MATSDPTTTRQRFLAAQERVAAGLQHQRQRILDRAAHAPRLHPSPDHEVIDLRGDRGNDIDYYVYELARLQDLAREIIKAFGQPFEVVEALAAFDDAIPALRQIRNPLTHPSDDTRLDGVAWFDAVVKLRPGGEVEYLVDPRHDHHDAAMELSGQLAAYLTARV